MANTFDIHDYLVNYDDFEPKPSVPVCIPRKPFRIEPDSECCAYLICPDKQWQLLHPDLANSGKVAGVLKAVLYHGMFDDGSSFILPVTYPDQNRNPSWFDGWQVIVQAAQKRWVTASKNDALSCYKHRDIKGIGQPDWSDLSMEQALELAFWQKHIDSLDHPLIVPANGKTYSKHDYNDYPAY